MKALPIKILIVWETTQVRLMMDDTCVAALPVPVYDTPTPELAEQVLQTVKELAKTFGRPVLLATASGKTFNNASN